MGRIPIIVFPGSFCSPIILGTLVIIPDDWGYPFCVFGVRAVSFIPSIFVCPRHHPSWFGVVGRILWRREGLQTCHHVLRCISSYPVFHFDCFVDVDDSPREPTPSSISFVRVCPITRFFPPPAVPPTSRATRALPPLHVTHRGALCRQIMVPQVDNRQCPPPVFPLISRIFKKTHRRGI